MSALLNTEATEEGLWLTVSELARLKGVDKSHISRQVTKLEEDGLLRTRTGPNRAKLVNLPEFDRLIGETTDLFKKQAASTAAANRSAEEGGSESGDPTFTEMQKKKLQYEAAMKALDYAERVKLVVPAQDLQRACEQISEVLVVAIDRMLLRADEVAAAAAKGSAGVRSVLKQMIFDLRTTAAEQLKRLPALAETDGPAEIDIDLPGES